MQQAKIDKESALASLNQGNHFLKTGQNKAALDCYEQAIALKEDYAEAWWKRGNALLNLGEYQAALSSYDAALFRQPHYPQAYNNRGLALQKLLRFAAALDSFNQAIALKPDYAIAFNNLGLLLIDMQRFAAAVNCFEQAVVLQPDFVEALNNQGNALQRLEHFPEALACYAKAIALRPDYAKAFNNRGSLLYQMKRYPEALANYAQALALQPDYPYLLGQYLFCKLQICCWDKLENELACLEQALQVGGKAGIPHAILALTDNPALQRKAAETWAQQYLPTATPPPAIPAHPSRHKIRVAYFSADFCMHPVSVLSAELYELHDRNRFEIIGFSLGPDSQDAMRQRLKAGFDRFFEVGEQSDQEIASLARSLEVDIAVDLGGYTSGGRPGIFAQRAAPVQIAYLGYPATLGAGFMDYLIADRVVIPDSSRSHYAEKIVYLPGSFMVNDSRRPIAAVNFQRTEMGLPETGFIFCAFNNHYKITPPVFACWMRILSATPDSVLWLSESINAEDNLRTAARDHGVAADRLIFAKKLPSQAEHLSRQRLADLFLDTLPYNAHTTACDALWAGLPVLTCAGESFPARVAASLLTAIGLPEMITQTPAAYERLAIELALDSQKLLAIRTRLAANRLDKALFDTKSFTRHLETAYLHIHSQRQNGCPAEDVEVKAD